jgi:predicted MFS family arabinose efflux permease
MPIASRFYGWTIAWVAFVVAVFAWGIGFYGPSVYLQTLHTAHGWSISAISGAITMHFLCSAAIVAYLPDIHRRLGIANTVAAGALLTAAGICAWANVTAPWQLYLAAIVSGSGWAVTSGATINAIVSRWFDRDRPRAIGLAFNGASVGGVLFPPLWVLLIAAMGFRLAALVVGIAAVAVLVPLSTRYLRQVPSDLGLSPDGASESSAQSESLQTRSRRSLLADPRFLTLSAPFALALFAQIGLFSHLIARLAPVTGATVAAAAVSLAAVCAVVGRTLLGGLVGSYDRRVIAAINFVVQVCGVALLVTGESTAILLMGCVVFGLGVGNLTSLPPLIAQKVFAAGDVGMVVALITAVNQAVFATAPAIFGLLRDATSSYEIPFTLAAAVQLLAAGLVTYGRRFDRELSVRSA